MGVIRSFLLIVLFFSASPSWGTVVSSGHDSYRYDQDLVTEVEKSELIHHVEIFKWVNE